MTPAETTPRAWDAGTLNDPHGQADKARRVRRMFDAIAPTYERVNRVTSAGRDRAWRRKAVELAAVRPDDCVLDVACGTGDLARAFASAGPARVVGADFSAPMLDFAAANRNPNAAIQWCRADAMALPFADGAFTIASCAFGVRNFQSLAAGLREMHRVLAPGGRIVILEFGLPRSALLRSAYRLYFRHVLPRVATFISGDSTGAYGYLPRSVETFLDANGMLAALQGAGFDHVAAHRLTFGIAVVFVAGRGH
jgi:demethylmenaquinone methyltransferase/2-methoxy-6-polyprenyl-1,4-benzoquinol methylase